MRAAWRSAPGLHPGSLPSASPFRKERARGSARGCVELVRDPQEWLHVDYDFVPETSHMHQIQAPEKCRELMLEFLQEIE